MSLIVDVAGMLGGMIATYAQLKKWSKPRIFCISSLAFFVLFTLFVIVFPSDKGRLSGIFLALGLGLLLGFTLVVLIFYSEQKK